MGVAKRTRKPEPQYRDRRKDRGREKRVESTESVGRVTYDYTRDEIRGVAECDEIGRCVGAVAPALSVGGVEEQRGRVPCCLDEVGECLRDEFSGRGHTEV